AATDRGHPRAPARAVERSRDVGVAEPGSEGPQTGAGAHHDAHRAAGDQLTVGRRRDARESRVRGRRRGGQGREASQDQHGGGDASGALLAVDEAAVEAAAESLGAERSIAVQADVRDRAGMATAVEDVVERLGGLDIVVANAGVAPATGTLRTLDPDDYDRVIAINQTGVFNTVRAAIEPIIASRGHMVVISSV